MPQALLSVCLLGPLLAAPGGGGRQPADSPRLAPVQPLDADAGAGYSVKRNRAGKVVEVVCDGVQVPITDPAADCAVARVADGSGLVILAGGIRESLDLYLVDTRGGLRQFRTQGGRRLPATFNGDLGSWPISEGLDLVLFAYEQAGHIRFWALDFAGCMHASHQLPMNLSGFAAEWLDERQEVRVVFDGPGSGTSIQFPHPTAARLDVAVQQVDFAEVPLGRVAEREVVLRNSGRRALEFRSQLEGTWFDLRDQAPKVIAPGAEARVVVRFRPQRTGERHGRLELRASGAVAHAVVTLQGRGAAGTPAAYPLRLPAPQPAAAPAQPAAPPPAPFDVSADIVSGGEVDVRGRLLAGAPPDAALVVRNFSNGETETAHQPRDRVRVAAHAGDELAVACAGGGLCSEWIMLEPLAPSLHADGDGVVLRVRPGAAYLLCAVATVDDPRSEGGNRERIARPLKSWRGQADATGSVRVSRAALGCDAQPLDLVLVIAGPRGPLRSPLLRLTN
jgi:hypothetical protein